MKNVVEIAQDLIKLLPEYDINTSMLLGNNVYLREFRTIGIRVPRRTGKTCALKYLAATNSALYFTKYGAGSLTGYTADNYRGRRNFNGLRYQMLLLDEYSTIPEEALKLIDILRYSDMLTKDFFILHAYT